MFSELRQAWKEAVANFWHELETDSEGDGSARGAYREVAKARNHVDRLGREIADCAQQVAHEEEQVEVCVRRQKMADGIGDQETSRIAAEYAGRHRERAAVLRRKRDALQAEMELCRRDLGEMEAALQSGRVGMEDVRPELDDLDRHPREKEFRDLEEGARNRSADERLEELKRRMGR